ncbi:prepilin peptidase, partial [Salmonella enterica subsp. enterica serovar Weltevreden]|nr:prepilin peptidase [Salmonella enterica subsp. enterica serovar Weltevreden]
VIIIFPLCHSLFSFMMSLVRLSLMILDDDQEWFAVFLATASTGFIWLYATAATCMMLSPVPLLERLMSLLFCLFLFSLTLTDAFTGFLPRELTIR